MGREGRVGGRGTDQYAAELGGEREVGGGEGEPPRNQLLAPPSSLTSLSGPTLVAYKFYKNSPPHKCRRNGEKRAPRQNIAHPGTAWVV